MILVSVFVTALNVHYEKLSLLRVVVTPSTFSVTGTINLSSGQIIINKDLTIAGPGAGNLTLQGGSRVFLLRSGVSNISGLTITGGNETSGILLMGIGASLNLSNAVVKGNSAAIGGGIATGSSETMTIVNSTISGNSATDDGGGVASIGSGTLWPLRRSQLRWDN